MAQSFKNALIFWFVLFFLLFLWYFREIIFVFFIGMILGLTIQTLALFLNYKLKTNYYLNVFLVYLLFFVLISFVFYLTLKVVLEEIPSLLEKIEPLLKQIDWQDFSLFKEWQGLLNLSSDYLTNLFKFLFNLFNSLISIVFIFVISFYTALSKNFPQGIFTLFPQGEEYARLWRRIKRKISFWILGQVFLMIFIGSATYLFLGLILKIPYAPLLSLVAGLLEIVPILGPAIALIFISLITLLHKPDLIFFVIAYFLFLQQLENHFLVPLVMKRAVEVNPLLVIFGILIGGKIGGILGIIIVLPLLGIMTEIFNYLRESSVTWTHRRLIQ